MAGQLFTSGTPTKDRSWVRLSTGRLVYVAGATVKFSDNEGGTWQDCTPTLDVVATGNTAVIERDNDDGLHILIGTGSPSEPLYLYFVKITGLTIASVRTQVEGNAGTNYNWSKVDIKVHSGANGAAKNILLAYDKVNYNSTSSSYPNVLYVRSASVATDGTATLGTRYTLHSSTEGGYRHIFHLSKSTAGVKLLYQATTSAFVKVVTLSAPLVSTPTQRTIVSGFYYMSEVYGVDGLDLCTWIGNSYYWTEDATGELVIPSLQWSAVTAVGDKPNNRILANSIDATTGKLKLWAMDLTTRASTDKGVIGSLASLTSLGAVIPDYKGKISVLERRSDGVWSEVINLGQGSGYHMII